MPHDLIGWLHTIAALIALITGTLVLINTKATVFHKRVGQVYGIMMIIVCLTSFAIYRVHNGFGVLHVFAIISTITLILGMLPMYVNISKNPITAHLAWMYWSVIGLYCAFTAEIFTRLPMLLDIKNSYGIFYALVGVSTGLVGSIGSYFFKRKKDIWDKRFGK